MNRPLIVSDCDEVLLHMVVPFREWLDEHHGIHFDFSSSFEEALRHKDSGDVVERMHVWRLLGGFFETEMHRQTAISGAVEAMTQLAERADVAIVTNIGEENAQARADQLHGVGLPFRVIGNRGGKGPVVARLIEEYRPGLTIFIDDLESNHASVAQHGAQVWRLQFVGEPEIAPYAPTSPDAHARIDDWASAERWIAAKLDELAEVEALMARASPDC
ncbi:MAG: HAD family hydrolase [Sphingobium sp.]|nr:HAD family hydrolase [Sphingobium sp.]